MFNTVPTTSVWDPKSMSFKDNTEAQAAYINLLNTQSDYLKQNIANQQQYNSIMDSKNTQNAWLGGTNAALQGISTIGGLVMSIKNYQMQKEALDKQKELITEQVNASKENRAQRRAEITRMNKVRSNTNKMFNNSAVVSRSY